MASMGAKDMQVESVDEEMNTTLVRDGAIEMELLELFEDITLEEVVVNKACIVLKRPWLVNGVLLNIKPWPVEGEVRTGEFAVARFWVQIHGLPTRCLTNDNLEIVAKKIGKGPQMGARRDLRVELQGGGVEVFGIEKFLKSLMGGGGPVEEKGKRRGWCSAEPLRRSKILEEKGQSYIVGTSSGSVILTEKTEAIPQEAFCIGVGDEASCSRSNGRGRKPKGRTAFSTRRSSGVKTRSGRKKCPVVDDNGVASTRSLEEILNNCIEVAVTFERDFGRDHDGKEPFGVWRVGDLNVIMNLEEKEGGKRFHDKEGDLLRDFLFDTGGIDLGCEGSTIGGEFDPLFVEKVTEADNDFMGRQPEVEEIREVVFKMHPLKAPGPDGFPGIFYRKYWHTVGPQLCIMVREFFASGVLDKKINHAFICLIPKKVQATQFDHFCPISLCNFSYKVISRILTDRLKVVIDRLISPCQSAFMPGRWIAEASIMAQEVLHSIKNKKGKVGAMAIKTDMSKAYDRLEWDFISHVLVANGFSSKVCNLIMQCITTVSFSILLNGAPLAPFNPKRGIRQGDPLSPFIFILCSEVLSKLIFKAERLGQLSGVRIARNSAPISHLFYADDSIFFCNATVANAENLLKCIHTYEEWSGQRVNKQKSGLVFSPNTTRSCRQELKQRMGIGCLNSSEKYLGNPFLFSANKRSDFQFIKEKITDRLEGWKARQLAQAGRSVLINSVLQTIPNYCMSTAVVPITLCNELDRILARFWWIGNSEKNRYCALKSWNDLCQPKACGGLGFRRMVDMNVALLAKLFWMVLKGEDKLWVHLLRDKYCRILSPWNVEKKDMDSRGWKSILEARKICLEGAGLLVADGSNDIWDRPWVPHISMEELKCGFQIRPNHSCWQIKDLFQNGLRVWNEDLVRSCFSPTNAEAILRIKPLDEGADVLFWKASKSGEFTVKSAYWLSQRHRFKEPLQKAVDYGRVFSVLEGELHGIKLALQMAKDSGFDSVIIETDSKAAVNAFESGQMPFCWDVYPLFCDCLRLCKNFRSCFVSFIPREQNLLADKLAKWARECSMVCKGRIEDCDPSLFGALL
uniref:Reverse transcriptase domain-containing protein n=1 Tax=Cannabis sativa TaxID=3483 RepID=A0A803NT67_CANSA